MSIGFILTGLLFVGGMLLLVSLLLMVVANAKERRQRLQMRYEASSAKPPSETVAKSGLRQSVSLRRPVTVAPWAPWGDDNSLRALFGRLRQWWLMLNRQEGALFLFVWLTLGLNFAIWLDLGIALSAAVGFVSVVLVWAIIYRHRRKKRLEQIAKDVPETLDMIVRSLRVGNPFSKSLLLIGDSMDGPIADEFSITVQEISYGHDLTIALQELAERCENQDLRFLATAVAIQQSSGGNLAEMLQRLAAICRARQQLAIKVEALTSEARWSGKVLSVFPVIAALGIVMLSPNYFDELAETKYLMPLLTAVGVLLVANIIFMRRMLVLED